MKLQIYVIFPKNFFSIAFFVFQKLVKHKYSQNGDFSLKYSYNYLKKFILFSLCIKFGNHFEKFDNVKMKETSGFSCEKLNFLSENPIFSQAELIPYQLKMKKKNFILNLITF